MHAELRTSSLELPTVLNEGLPGFSDNTISSDDL